MMTATAMNVYLRATNTPAKMTLKNSQGKDRAIEEDSFGDGLHSVRERKQSISLWKLSSSLNNFNFFGGGKCGRGTGSVMNIFGVNGGLPAGGIFVRGQSNSFSDICWIFSGKVFPLQSVGTALPRLAFLLFFHLSVVNVMPNEIGLFFLFFICHLDTCS